MANSNRKEPLADSKIAGAGQKETRSHRPKVNLKPSELAAINAKKGRLSLSEYLRDRALFDDQHYVPHIATIGEMYLAAGSIINASRCLREHEDRLREIEDDLLEKMRTGKLGREAASTIVNDLGQHFSRLLDAVEDLEALGQSLQDHAREMGRQHLGKMRERHATPTIKRRRTKKS